MVDVLISIAEYACLTKHGWTKLHDGTDPKTTPPPPSRLREDACSQHTAQGTSPTRPTAQGETLSGESSEDESQADASQGSNVPLADGAMHARLQVCDSAPPPPDNWAALASEPMELDFAGVAPKNKPNAHGSNRAAKKLQGPPTTLKKPISEVSQRRGAPNTAQRRLQDMLFRPSDQQRPMRAKRLLLMWVS